jgi:Kef-type K+ transport system membrane component KefB
VLSDLGRLDDPEGQVVLGAAVIDDVIGLIILAVIAAVVAGEEITGAGIALTTLSAFGFLAVTLLVGRLVVPELFDLLARLGRESNLAVMGLALALLLSLAAEEAGSALIIGAFAAGLLLEPTIWAPIVREGMVRLGTFLVPIFFVAVGAALDVRTFADPGVLTLGLGLLVVGIVGKVAAGYAPWWFRGRKLVVGVAMVPRGEVGLIFAQMGLAAGAVTTGQYAALLLMVMGTTFVAPPALRALLGRAEPPTKAGGASELVTEI